MLRRLACCNPVPRMWWWRSGRRPLRVRRGVCAAATCVVTALSQPAPAQIGPGEYVFEQGRGALRIAAGRGGDYPFHISTVGANFHICELQGMIRNNQAHMPDSAHEKLPCVITFRARGNGIAVASQHEGACSTYCGMRARFDGFYTRPPVGCEPSKVRQTRERFKTTYDRKQYTQALGLLRPVLDRCGVLLDRYDDGWVRNDLAITYYRAGDKVSCLGVLKPWLEVARQPDRALREGYPPSDAEEILRLAHATRANLKVCGGG